MASCLNLAGDAAVPNLGGESWAVPLVLEHVEAAPGQERVVFEQAIAAATAMAEVGAPLQQTFLPGLVSSSLYRMSVAANLGLGLVSGGVGGSTGKVSDGCLRIPLSGAWRIKTTTKKLKS